MLSGTRGMAKEGERMAVQERAEGGVPGVLIEGNEERSKRRDFLDDGGASDLHGRKGGE